MLGGFPQSRHKRASVHSVLSSSHYWTMDGLSWTMAFVALIQASDILGHVIVATARPTGRTRHDRRSPGKRAEETCGQREWPGRRPGHNASQETRPQRGDEN